MEGSGTYDGEGKGISITLKTHILYSKVHMRPPEKQRYACTFPDFQI